MKGWIKTISLVFLLAGCQQEDDWWGGNDFGEAERIQFAVPSLSVAEVRSTSKNVLAEGDIFGVLGYCVPYVVGSINMDYNAGTSEWSVKKSQSFADVFNCQPVKIVNGGGQYNMGGGTDSNNPKFWYSDGKGLDGKENSNVVNAENYHYSFMGYYPYSFKERNDYFSVSYPSNLNSKPYGPPIITFTMPQSGENSGAIDTNPLDHTLTPDAMLGVIYNHTKADGNLRFNFSHMLTALGFEINNYSDYKLTIHAVKLRGKFFKQISVNFNNNPIEFSFPDTRYTGYYQLLEDELSLNPVEGEPVRSSGLLGGEHLLLISGENDYFGEDVEVVVDYTFEDGLTPERRTFTQARPGTFVPKPGVKYTAQLNFVGDTFVLQFVVDNNESWEDGEADDNQTDNDDVTFE